MVSKSVNLSDEAYEILKSWKVSEDESFSSLIVRILPMNKDLSEDFLKKEKKSTKFLTHEEAEQLRKEIE